MLILYMKILKTRVNKFLMKKCVSNMCVETGFHIMKLGSCEVVCRQKVWKNIFPFSGIRVSCQE